MQSEQEIVNAGAEIIWVLEQTPFVQPANAQDCRAFMDDLGSTLGWCVGDAETSPTPGTFDNSPFSVQRGFDMIVPRGSMDIRYTTTHGTTNGNENLSGEDILAEVQAIVASLP